MINLNDSVNSIKGIGTKKQDRLAHMGIYCVADMIEHFPIRYKDKRIACNSSEVKADELSLVVGVLKRVNLKSLPSGIKLIECQFEDCTGKFIATFFNMPFLKQTLNIGTSYSIYGMMKMRNGFKVWTNPEIAECGSAADRRGIIPIYRCTQGITNNDFNKWIEYILSDADFSSDWVDEDILRHNKICSLEYAYRNIHFPESNKHYQTARYRLVYDQLLIYQLAVKMNRKNREDESLNSSIEDVSVKDFLNSLSFKLTEGQLSCLKDIEKDLVSNKPMNRLVQGDVGCGKTVVAEAAMYKCIKAGHQAAMMAPTEILARQHYERISRDLNNLGYRTALLVSGIKISERRKIISQLENGDIDVVIGTHAIIQNDVIFHDLALVITDEQHRFGVNQRKVLANKGKAVNVLVMSATPIPRTLEATVYGDMDFSIIKDKPSNRHEIITKKVDSSSRERAYIAVREQLELGHQAYVVCPSIDTDDDDISSVQQLYSELSSKFNDYNVALIHGKLDKSEKETIMQSFADGYIDVLVATVVIEVGIDVANATIVVLENSERYGLAQMHQIRGRVGRSNHQSYCYLVNYSKSETATLRAQAMVSISDGFEISEEDYRLRGPGDIMGTMQSGNFTSHILSLCNYKDILNLAINDADYILNNPSNTNLEYVINYISHKNSADYSNII